MVNKLAFTAILTLTGWFGCSFAYADESPDSLSRPLLNLQATTFANFGSGDFAPYYIASNSLDLFTQPQGIQEYLRASRPLSFQKRFEYGFGVSALAGYASNVDYQRYDATTQTWTEHGCHPGYISLRELWAGAKFRGVFIYAGMKPDQSGLFNSPLASGDLVLSNNARPIPQVRAGFIDFQNIPFTNGWAQIQGELAWGKFADNGWLEDHFNYYNSFITTGSLMHYSRLYLRSNPDKPFSVTVGMQQATQFGGIWHRYADGKEFATIKTPVKFKDFVNAIFPWAKGSAPEGLVETYYSGNHLGSWDLLLRYRFANGSTLKAYMQSPWEDGSGIGKLNGFDGVWGLQYDFADNSPIIKSILAEYIDLTNQSGPMHWDPADFPGTAIPGEATGADDYYNNVTYNGWANYGMSIGSPFVKAPIYNTDGYLRFTDNRVRGFQLGAEGAAGENMIWRAIVSHRTSWGTPFVPAPKRRHDTSAMLNAQYTLPRNPNLSLGATVAFDAGTLYGDNFGVLLNVSYQIPVYCK
ncbi:MAG: capsule assembly Wzi family protein [Prevotella sp.]|nr:capsule assembly Wzi family protein [Prevotella sp.]MCM1075449.1 capsule assembly Wzi family protein [Ruminococcus sp.]